MFSCIGKNNAFKGDRSHPPLSKKRPLEPDSVACRLVKHDHDSSNISLEKPRSRSNEKVPWFSWSFRRKKKPYTEKMGIIPDTRVGIEKYQKTLERKGSKKGIMSWNKASLPSFVDENDKSSDHNIAEDRTIVSNDYESPQFLVKTCRAEVLEGSDIGFGNKSDSVSVVNFETDSPLPKNELIQDEKSFNSISLIDHVISESVVSNHTSQTDNTYTEGESPLSVLNGPSSLKNSVQHKDECVEREGELNYSSHIASPENSNPEALFTPCLISSLEKMIYNVEKEMECNKFHKKSLASISHLSLNLIDGAEVFYKADDRTLSTDAECQTESERSAIDDKLSDAVNDFSGISPALGSNRFLQNIGNNSLSDPACDIIENQSVIKISEGISILPSLACPHAVEVIKMNNYLEPVLEKVHSENETHFVANITEKQTSIIKQFRGSVENNDDLSKCDYNDLNDCMGDCESNYILVEKLKNPILTTNDPSSHHTCAIVNDKNEENFEDCLLTLDDKNEITFENIKFSNVNMDNSKLNYGMDNFGFAEHILKLKLSRELCDKRANIVNDESIGEDIEMYNDTTDHVIDVTFGNAKNKSGVDHVTKLLDHSEQHGQFESSVESLDRYMEDDLSSRNDKGMKHNSRNSNICNNVIDSLFKGDLQRGFGVGSKINDIDGSENVMIESAMKNQSSNTDVETQRTNLQRNLGDDADNLSLLDTNPETTNDYLIIDTTPIYSVYSDESLSGIITKERTKFFERNFTTGTQTQTNSAKNSDVTNLFIASADDQFPEKNFSSNKSDMLTLLSRDELIYTDKMFGFERDLSNAFTNFANADIDNKNRSSEFFTGDERLNVLTLLPRDEPLNVAKNYCDISKSTSLFIEPTDDDTDMTNRSSEFFTIDDKLNATTLIPRDETLSIAKNGDHITESTNIFVESPNFDTDEHNHSSEFFPDGDKLKVPTLMPCDQPVIVTKNFGGKTDTGNIFIECADGDIKRNNHSPEFIFDCDKLNMLTLIPRDELLSIKINSLLDHNEAIFMGRQIFGNRKVSSTKNLPTKLNRNFKVRAENELICNDMEIVDSLSLLVPSLIDFYETTFGSKPPSPIQKVLSNPPSSVQWKPQIQEHPPKKTQEVMKLENVVESLREELKRANLQKEDFCRLEKQNDELLQAIKALKDELDERKSELASKVSELNILHTEMDKLQEINRNLIKSIEAQNEAEEKFREQETELKNYYAEELKRTTSVYTAEIEKEKRENKSLMLKLKDNQGLVEELKRTLLLPVDTRYEAQIEKQSAEISSLHTVLAMRNEELKDCRAVARELQLQQEELLTLRDRLQKTELAKEDLFVRLQMEREEKRRCEQKIETLTIQLRSDSNKLKRVSMDKEQLEYRLSSAGLDVCGSPLARNNSNSTFSFNVSSPNLSSSTVCTSPKPQTNGTSDRQSLSPVPQSPGVMRRVVEKSESLSYVLGFEEEIDDMIVELRSPKKSV
ncbi:uncharacterized protein LOC136040603 [Artemia franciscana]|uniref:Uncharacterized protein n=1 Tax=Artemia franciscana TaxID=6661 RepID=A0AA88HX92_ARTSF|nr:hypothetical protein QYM36_009664 [Artemia franciscana]